MHKKTRKLSIFYLLSSASLLLISASGITVCAGEENSLPAGNYIYLGPGQTGNSPRAFSVDSQGKIRWQESTPSTVSTQSTVSKGSLPTPGGRKKKQYQWDSYKFPIIKWKIHPITTVPDGTAQLTTTFNPDGGPLRNGVVKYNLTLSKFDSIPNTVTVQLLDINGFKLNEFSIYKDAFHPVPGTALVEASDENQCSSSDYRKVRDYLVK